MLLLVLAMSFAVVAAREFTAEELARFPRLFHLDDYERCLARPGGLYCLGTFELTPERYPHPTYELMKEYSNNRRRHFNRTLIHRGYCLSERCPSAVRNASLRFEGCADRFARARSLRANLRQLEYCRSHADAHAQVPPSAAQQTFLNVVYAILALNIIGTAYDIMTKNKPNKNKLLTSWSIPANWRELTSVEIGKDARTNLLLPLQGFRVVCILTMSFFHTTIFYSLIYVKNPEIVENILTYRADAVFQSDGTSMAQIYIVLSSFLTCYNLLLFSEKHALSFKILPIFILKRAIRLTPVHLFIVGFGATWWLHIRDGPLVTSVLSAESRACEPKFWYHAFFLNNLNNEAGYCITPTWFLPADMHLSILACSMTVVLRCRRGTILKLYIALAAAFWLLNVVVIKQYKSFEYFTSPESVRGSMRDSPHITDFYMTTWTSLSSCFVGMIIAHIQYEIQRRNVKLSEYKWAVFLHMAVSVALIVWAFASHIIRHLWPQLLISAFNAVDKPAFYIIIIVIILGLININGQSRKLMCWKGFRVMARLSLPVMLLHWCVGMIIVARPTAFAISTTNQLLDWITMNVITHALAVPITLFLEMPAQRFLSFLIF